MKGGQFLYSNKLESTDDHLLSQIRTTRGLMAIGKTTKLILVLFFISILQIFCSLNCSCIDTITYNQSITYSEFIVSPNKKYKLGFFSPINTTNRYVGIMFSFPSTVFWVANRNKPLNDAAGILTISKDGNLVILNAQKELIWSSNVSSAVANSSARLLDTGNLVLEDNSNGKIIWKSFKHPTDSLLPTMIISTNVKTGEKTWLTSWRSHSDPSIGSFSAGLSPLNNLQLFVWNGSNPSWRSGPWNGQIFIGIPHMSPGIAIAEDKEGNFTLSYPSSSEYSIYHALNPDGSLVENFRYDPNDDWNIIWSSQANECDFYGKCGPFGKCNPNDSPICSCLSGFEPKDWEEWGQRNWTRGCKRKMPLKCERNTTVDRNKEDEFLQLASMKVPDFAEWAPAIGDDNCRSQCMSNCSCIAYAYYNGVGCMLWNQSLIDIQEFSSGGTDLYIRLSNEEPEKKKHTTMVIAVTTVIGSITIAICACLFWRWTAKQRGKKKARELLLLQRGKVHAKHSTAESIPQENLSHIKLEELPLFSFHKVANATNNFSLVNKLGKGGFGLVYKGTLEDGQEIAVKRLSRSSEQGPEEFKNEVILISKLQHRNLVRLLGFCVEGEEKMLIYEYMPNGSLDTFLSDSPKKKLLNWRKRVKIIEGIIRGLLYLHQDSRLRIIHRDLKASNILLDKELNPKISDFGMARIFSHKQDQADTRRVVGTYGYMAPEYVIEGRFSEKSDIYSFGVLLLEIVYGRKNSSFYHDELSLSLVAFVWRLWKENRILTSIDPMIFEPRFQMEILKYIHIGLLCVQESPNDRPTISTVLSMLSSDIADLASPKPPAYTQRQNQSESDSSQNIYSINSVTNTIIEGR